MSTSLSKTELAEEEREEGRRRRVARDRPGTQAACTTVGRDVVLGGNPACHSLSPLLCSLGDQHVGDPIMMIRWWSDDDDQIMMIIWLETESMDQEFRFMSNWNGIDSQFIPHSLTKEGWKILFQSSHRRWKWASNAIQDVTKVCWGWGRQAYLIFDIFTAGAWKVYAEKCIILWTIATKLSRN